MNFENIVNKTWGKSHKEHEDSPEGMNRELDDSGHVEYEVPYPEVWSKSRVWRSVLSGDKVINKLSFSKAKIYKPDFSFHISWNINFKDGIKI